MFQTLLLSENISLDEIITKEQCIQRVHCPPVDIKLLISLHHDNRQSHNHLNNLQRRDDPWLYITFDIVEIHERMNKDIHVDKPKT